MAFTYVELTGTYELADDVPASGSIELAPVDRMRNGITVVSAPVVKALDADGVLNVRVAATTDPGTVPAGVTYRVTYRIDGQPNAVRYVSVPHDQGASLELESLTVLPAAAQVDESGAVLTINGEPPDGAGNVVLSASDVGAQLADADLTALSGLGDGVPVRTNGAWSTVDPGGLGGGGGGAVSSVNGKTGTVALGPSDVGAQPASSELSQIAALLPANGDTLHRVDGVWTTTPLPSGGGGGGGAVSSVNGRTGAVTGLAEGSDLSALSTSTTNALAGKANTSHTHAQGDISGLTSALAGKAGAASSGAKLWIGTQSAYNALGTYDATTAYVVTG